MAREASQIDSRTSGASIIHLPNWILPLCLSWSLEEPGRDQAQSSSLGIHQEYRLVAIPTWLLKPPTSLTPSAKIASLGRCFR
jgi:hypothetical protein